MLGIQRAGWVLSNAANASTYSVVQSFEQCWSPLREFEDLQSFCGAIASVMPGTSGVESDFSDQLDEGSIFP